MKLSDKLLENILRDIDAADLSNDVVIMRKMIIGQEANKKIINHKKMYECEVTLLQCPYHEEVDDLDLNNEKSVWTYYRYDLRIGLFNGAQFYVNFKINAQERGGNKRKEILNKEIKKMFKEFNNIGELE